MAECAFRNCINHGERKVILDSEELPEVTYHLFPKNISLRAKWLKQMNQEDWEPSHSSALCSLHFNKDYFIEDERGIPMLKPDAIPTEFELYQKEMVDEAPLGCCAYKCENTFSQERAVTFHPFPLEQPELCAQWLAAMNCSQLEASQAVLCSEHFDESCFVVGDDGQKYLISDAVPSLFAFPEANDSVEEPRELEPNEVMDVSEIPPGMTIKYEVSEDNLELIRHHDEVVGGLMDESLKLLELTQKRRKLERTKKSLEMLLRATVHNTFIDRDELRRMRPVVKDIDEHCTAILRNCVSPCVVGSVSET